MTTHDDTTRSPHPRPDDQAIANLVAERGRSGSVRGWLAKALDPVQLSASSSRWTWRPAVALATGYIFLGSMWIVTSSSIASGSSIRNPEILKGLAFIAVTGVLLGALLLHYGNRAQRSANRLRELIESTGDLTFRYRLWPDAGFDYVSPHVESWLGGSVDEFDDHPELFARHVHPDDRARFSQLLAHADHAGPVLIRWVAPDGRVFHSLIDVRSISDRKGRTIAIDGRIRDVTEQRLDRAESEVGSAILGRLANGDPLPLVLDGVCEQIVELMGVEVAAVGVPMLDGTIDLFSASGDTDAIGSIQIRWDEGPLADGPTGRAVQERGPVVMTPNEGGFSAWRHRAHEVGITACLAVPIVRGDRTVATLTLWSRFGNPFDDSNIDRFDRIGRRLAFAVAQLPEAPIRAAHVVSSDAVPPIDVRRALDEGRIEPWWQPQVDCDGRIVALEMLLRMHDDDGQIVPPNVVIPAAEQLGLMSTIGRSLRRKAVEQSQGWFEMGLERICLNVSVDELMSPGFLGEMEDLISRDEVRPDQIEIELVETAPLDAAAQRVLGHVVELGFRVAVDDYGSGWASLSHLSKLPAKVIKVDRVFIRDIAESERARALVKSTFELGRSLELITVAEGVEHAEQARLLVELGCDLMQGFLFSPPAAAEHVDALLRSGERPFWPIIASSLRREHA